MLKENLQITLPTTGFPFDLIQVEGGRFMMGGQDEEASDDEKPVHEVSLADFYLGKYPVTQGLWKAVMGEENNPSNFKGDNRPVERVSWNDVQDFLKKLNELTGQSFRLPSEAEWDYAARGGKQSQGHKYAGSPILKEVGWFSGNSYGETKPVGMKAPNELGLYDMSGNVWEWCEDWYSREYYDECKKQGTVNNPLGPERGGHRVIRGGSWYFDPQYCRVAARYFGDPTNRSDDVGFRLALSPQSDG